MPDLRNVVVIGGGLAGLSAAQWAMRQGNGIGAVVLEKADRPLDWLSANPCPMGRASPEGLPVAEDYPVGWPDLERILEKWTGNSSRDWLVSLGLELVDSEDGSFFCPDGRGLREVFLRVVEDMAIQVRTGFPVETISIQPEGGFRVWSRDGWSEEGGQLLLATGGDRNHGLKLAGELGLETRPPEAAFTRLRLASPKLGSQLGPLNRIVGLRCLRSGQRCTGEISLSPRGLEGPAVSRLSAQLHPLWKQLRHRLQVEIDWFPELKGSSIRQELASRCERGGRRPVGQEPLFGLTLRQWDYFLQAVRIDPELVWPRVKAKKVQALTQRLKSDPISVEGMGLPAGERAWAGGVALSSLDLGTCQSTGLRGLYCAGEMLDFVGLPDGPHLNAVWASAYLAGSSMGMAARQGQ